MCKTTLGDIGNAGLGEGSAVESHDITLQKYPLVIWFADSVCKLVSPLKMRMGTKTCNPKPYAKDLNIVIAKW